MFLGQFQASGFRRLGLRNICGVGLFEVSVGKDLGFGM